MFTSGTKEYADSILDQIDPLYSYIKFRLYRHHTRRLEDSVIKDLSELGRDLGKVVIIDNIEENYLNQYNNGLLSLTWTDNLFDSQLNDFLDILKFLKNNNVENIPHFISKLNREIDKRRESSARSENSPKNYYSGLDLRSFL